MASRPLKRVAAVSTPSEAYPEALFRSVYVDHVQFVFSVLLSFGVSLNVVEDAVQDVFVVVHRRLGEFEGRAKHRTWLFEIALRVAHDYRRSARRRPTEALSEGVADHAPTPADLAVAHEALAHVAEILDGLDDEKRAVIVLADIHGMTANEIAEVVGVNVNTVYSRLRLAREAFEKALARQRAKDRNQGDST